MVPSFRTGEEIELTKGKQFGSLLYKNDRKMFDKLIYHVKS